MLVFVVGLLQRQVRRHQAVARVECLRQQARSSSGSASSSSAALYYEDDFLSEDDALPVQKTINKRAVVSTATDSKGTISSSGGSPKGELSSNDTHVSHWDTSAQGTAAQAAASPQRVRAHKSSAAARAHVSAAAAAQSDRQ